MQEDYRNIYQSARKIAGYTQEKAAELIDVSIESIRAYESDITIPPNIKVLSMVQVYGTPHLAMQHLVYSSEIGRKVLPHIDVQDLPSAILHLQKEVMDFIKCRDELIDITYDGKITPEERVRFNEILKELDDIVRAIYNLKYAHEKKD